MLRYIIGISLITLVLIILRKVMGDRISKTLRYCLWIIVPLYMVLAPFYSIDVVVPSKMNVVSEQVNQIEMVTNGDLVPVPLGQQNDSDKVAADAFSAQNFTHIDWLKTIKYAYISITVLVIIGISVYNMGFIYYCRKKRNFVETNSCGLKVYNIDHSSAPFLLGNKIYLSDSVTEDMRKYAICHEYCHYKHGDMFWNIIRYLVLAVNFYNPIVWYAFVLSEQDCELACDESVLKMFGSEQSVEYGKVLLNLLSNKSLGKHDFYLSTTMHGRNKRFMKERIVSIKSNRKYSIVPICLTMAIVIATTGCSLIKTKSQEDEVAAHNAEVDSVVAEIDAANYLATLEVEEHSKEVQEVLAMIDEYDTKISDLPDGMYTVTLETMDYVAGVQVCIVYPWTQFEFNQDYIDNLKIGDEIDISNSGYGFIDEAGNVNYYQSIEVTELTSMRCKPATLYGTEYDGSMLVINEEHSVYLLKVAGSDTWKLFNGNDIPLFVVGEEMNILLGEDLTLYDASQVFAENNEDTDLSDEELKAVEDFKTNTNSNIISSYCSYAGFEEYAISGDAVINVVNNRVTEIYYGNHR